MQGGRRDNNRRRIRCNTLRIVSCRERRRWSEIVRRSRKAILRQVPKTIVPSRAGEQARMKKRVQSSGSV
jgi:hypothetical protein